MIETTAGAAPGRDLVLYPGDFVFAEAPTRLRTLLGSCVSVTWWHPGTRLGAMCHFLVPHRARRDGAGQALDGRYADEAVEMFLRHAGQAGTRPQEWVVKVFGGGSQFAFSAGRDDVSLPDRNVEAAFDLLARHRMSVSARHVGGSGHRQVVFDLGSGTVWLRHESRDGTPDRPQVRREPRARHREEVPA